MPYEEKLEILRNRLKTINGTTEFDYAQDWTERRMDRAVTAKDKCKVLRSYFKLIRIDK